jgi:tRNA(Ser,Leu) C12 N-acetylase TAN1
MMVEQLDFFPMNRAMSLAKEVEDETDTKLDELNEKVDTLLEKIREQVSLLNDHSARSVSFE